MEDWRIRLRQNNPSGWSDFLSETLKRDYYFEFYCKSTGYRIQAHGIHYARRRQLGSVATSLIRQSGPGPSIVAVSYQRRRSPSTWSEGARNRIGAILSAKLYELYLILQKFCLKNEHMIIKYMKNVSLLGAPPWNWRTCVWAVWCALPNHWICMTGGKTWCQIS